jgi:uncharacterized protein (DUF305 family)
MKPVRIAGFAAGVFAAAALAAGAARPGSAPPYTDADLTFLTHMVLHHEQALELCALVPTHSSREEFQRFARYVNDSQQAEINQMQGLLRMATDRGAVVPEHHMHGDPPMAGMLSRAQMTAIAESTGPQFEQLWLKGMIQHHQGAVDMALAQQEAQFHSGNQPWGVDVLVDDMLAVQRAEIDKMNTWLRQWH